MVDRVMEDLCNSKHVNVQQRCHEYQAIKQVFQTQPAISDIYKNTPMTEDVAVMQGFDFDLAFLDDFVH